MKAGLAVYKIVLVVYDYGRVLFKYGVQGIYI
jgi:hypothetical protein